MANCQKKSDVLTQIYSKKKEVVKHRVQNYEFVQRYNPTPETETELRKIFPEDFDNFTPDSQIQRFLKRQMQDKKERMLPTRESKSERGHLVVKKRTK